MVRRHARPHVVLDESSRLACGLRKAAVPFLGRSTIEVPENVPPICQKAGAICGVELNGLLVINVLEECGGRPLGAHPG